MSATPNKGGNTELLKWIEKTGLGRMVWATDLDSTLIDPQADPDTAYAPPGLEDNCRTIEQKTGGAFFIITGRDLDYVDNKVFKETRFPVSAEYHSMMRYAPDEEAEHLNPMPRWDMVDADLATLTASFSGLRLRKKLFMRSLHFSQVPEGDRDAVKAYLRENLVQLVDELNEKTGQNVKLTDGGLIFDMGPGGADKAKAMEDILRYLGRRDSARRVPIYFGDSPGDLPAGRVARAKGGVFVCVGNDPRVQAEADFVLKDTEECRALLAQAARLQAAQSKPAMVRALSF